MARIAFILLCHKDPEGVIAQALRLTAAGDYVAIHFDARASSRDYDHGYARFKHPAGCGCCGSGRRSATVTAPNGAKSAPSRRPWMISH